MERDDAVALAERPGARRRARRLRADAYPELVDGRLDGKPVGVVFVGSVDQGVAGAIRRAVADAGGRVALHARAARAARLRERRRGARRRAGDADLAGPDRRERLGRELARELVTGGPDADLGVSPPSSSRSSPASSRVQLDAVVVARPGAAAAGRDAGLPRRALQRARGGTRIPSVGVDERGRGGAPLPTSSGVAASRPSTAIDDGRRSGRARLPARRGATRELRHGPGRRRRRPARPTARAAPADG